MVSDGSPSQCERTKDDECDKCRKRRGSHLFESIWEFILMKAQALKCNCAELQNEFKGLKGDSVRRKSIYKEQAL